MAKKRSRRREWTKDDVRELKTLARQKMPARKIARSLKRTEGATRQKAFSLGVSLDSASVSSDNPSLLAIPPLRCRQWISLTECALSRLRRRDDRLFVCRACTPRLYLYGLAWRWR